MHPFLTGSRQPLKVDLQEILRRRHKGGPDSPERAARPPRRRGQYTLEEQALAERMLAKLKRGEDVRPDKVAAGRAAFAGGELDDPMLSSLKLDVAVDRLLDDLLEA
jgi:hypothetical protein